VELIDPKLRPQFIDFGASVSIFSGFNRLTSGDETWTDSSSTAMDILGWAFLAKTLLRALMRPKHFRAEQLALQKAGGDEETYEQFLPQDRVNCT